MLGGIFHLAILVEILVLRQIKYPCFWCHAKIGLDLDQYPSSVFI